jgi:hypothetical protein
VRFWRPLEETPTWFAGRTAQAFYLFCMVFLIAGLVASFVVRVESSWIRVFGAALAALGALVVAMLLVRSERVRRHHEATGDSRGRRQA